MSKTLKELVEIVQFKLKLKQEDVARELGYSRGHFSTLLRDNDLGAVNKLYLKYDNILHDVGRKPDNSMEGKHSSSEDFYIDTIKDLRKTILTLSETNKEATVMGKETAIANRILAENQTPLIEILKVLHSSIARGVKGSRQEVGLQLQPYLEKIAVGGVPELWKSKDAGLLKLGKLLVGDAPVKKE